jgi:hypothetical protein
MAARETYYGALNAQLQSLITNGTVKRIARKVTLSDVNNPPKLPAIYIDGDKEHVEHMAGQTARVTMTVRLFVYVPAPDNEPSPGTALSTVLDAIDLVLAPAAGQSLQTLGGLVAHCWIEGEIERFEAGLVGKALAIVPVHMTVIR